MLRPEFMREGGTNDPATILMRLPCRADSSWAGSDRPMKNSTPNKVDNFPSL